MPKLLPALAFALICTTAILPAYAEDAYDDYLLGDMGGVRPVLDGHGVTLALEYTGDFWNVSSGNGNNGSNYIDNLNIVADVDGEKAYGLSGNTLHIYFLNNAGGKPNHRARSIEGIDNIEVEDNTFKLYELWTEQSFFHEKASILAGLYDLNSEFFFTDMSANFLKPTFEVNQEIAQSGQNGPSIFPTTSLAARLKIKPIENTYMQFAVLDGVPGNPDRPHGTHVDFEKGDGALMITELGYTPGNSGDSETNKFAIGAWRYTKRFDDVVETDALGNPKKDHSEGLYALSSYVFYNDKTSGHSLGGFLRGGVGDGDTGQTEWSYTAGLVAGGWVPTRPEGEFGLGISQAHNGDKFERAASLAGTSAEHVETGLEAYYTDHVYRGIYLQPDVQYVINPSTDPAQDDVLAVALRMGIAF